MANNILTAEIKVIAPGAAEAFNKVSKDVKKTEVTLQQVGTTSVSTGKTITVLSDNVKKTGEAAAKSTGGLKNLVSGLNLTGVAGIAALGVLAALGKEVFALIIGENKLASSTTMLAEAQQKAAASTKEEVVQLGLLYGVARNTANSYGERQAAIEKMNKLYPDLLRNINLENIGTLEVAASIGAVIQNLVKKAQLQEVVSKIAQLSNAAEEISNLKLFGPLSNERERELKVINDRIIQLTRSAIELQSAALGTSFKNIGAIAGGAGEAPQKEIKVPKIKIDKIDKLTWTDLIDWSDSPESPANKIYTEVTEAGERIFNGMSNIPELSSAGERSAEIFKNAFESRLTSDETTDFGLIDLLNNGQATDEAIQLGKDTAEAFNYGLQSTLTGGISSLASGIGEALSGGGIQSAFAAFGNAIGDGLQRIGEQLIAIGVAAILAKNALKSLFANPALAIAAGVALTVAGAAFKSVLSKGLTGRAAGGPVFAGHAYEVGEVGKELFVPNTGGQIVPHYKLNNRGIGASGGMMVQVSGEFVQRGQDLVAVLTLANQSRNRLQ